MHKFLSLQYLRGQWPFKLLQVWGRKCADWLHCSLRQTTREEGGTESGETAQSIVGTGLKGGAVSKKAANIVKDSHHALVSLLPSGSDYRSLKKPWRQVWTTASSRQLSNSWAMRNTNHNRSSSTVDFASIASVPRLCTTMVYVSMCISFQRLSYWLTEASTCV